MNELFKTEDKPMKRHVINVETSLIKANAYCQATVQQLSDSPPKSEFKGFSIFFMLY